MDIPAAPAQAERIASPSEAQPPNPPEVEAKGPAEEPAPAPAPAPTPAPAPVVERSVERTDPAPAAPAPAIAGFPVEGRPQPEVLEVPANVAAVVNAMDRYDSDRDLDAGRHPGELLAFLGLKKGMHVGELFAGKGYTTELLARAVGSSGVVWAENPPALLRSVGRQFGERLGKGVMGNTNRVDAPADAAWPSEARNLDAIVIVLAYHDAAAMGVDRAAMNKAAFEALKPGGEYVLVDHSAVPGHGTKDCKSLHRVDETTVIREVTAAGFKSDDSADFLRNPNDNRDWNASPAAAGDKRGTSDRFVLKFVRP
ncbi:MAG TPA: SAM-dependent methyltransferase [Polyangiaceae bacterium]|jgi:predicted methyltransferase|nr:SAM-dependent methyltransferase [Polyangiaceae bacterium]